jgi:GNAT superfamily N-acetyltransferase
LNPEFIKFMQHECQELRDLEFVIEPDKIKRTTTQIEFFVKAKSETTHKMRLGQIENLRVANLRDPLEIMWNSDDFKILPGLRGAGYGTVCLRELLRFLQARSQPGPLRVTVDLPKSRTKDRGFGFSALLGFYQEAGFEVTQHGEIWRAVYEGQGRPRVSNGETAHAS